MKVSLENVNWLSAADIRGARFTTRRGSYAAAEVRDFLERVAQVFEDHEQRLHQIHDQLLIAENDRRDVAKLRREFAAAEIELEAMADRVNLAETVRDEALQRLAQYENQAPAAAPPVDEESLKAAEAAFEQLMHEAGEAAGETRAAAREEARSIVDAAAVEAKRTLARASAEAGRMLVAAQSVNSAMIAAKRREPVDAEGRRPNVDAMVLLAKAEELMSAAASLPMADAHRVLRERLADRARRMREQPEK